MYIRSLRLGVAAKEVDATAATSLQAVAARARMGADVAGGLRSVAERSTVPAHWERLAVCWQLAPDTRRGHWSLMQTV